MLYGPRRAESSGKKKCVFPVILVLVASLCLFPATSPVCFAAIGDITGHWAQKSIEVALAKGIIRGYADGTFKPDNPVTQNEAVIMIVRGMGLEQQAGRETVIPPEFQNPEFVPDWAVGYVAVAVKEGIFTDDDLSSFAGYKDTPRWKAAVWLARAMGLRPSSSPPEFTDMAGVPSWALGYITAASERGLVTGTAPGRFSPHSSVTRAQMAALLCRFDENVRNSLDDLEVTGEVTSISFTDDTITVKPQGQTSARTFTLRSGIPVYEGDTRVQRSAISQGDQVRLILDAQNRVQFAEILPSSSTISGVLSSKLSMPQVRLITVEYVDEDGEEQVDDFTLASDVVIEKDEKSATFNDLYINDLVTVVLRSGKVISIKAESHSRELEGTLKALAFGEKPMLTIETETGTRTYPIAEDVTIKRDKTKVGLTALRVSDKIEIAVEGGEITEIQAEGTSDTVEGTLVSITIAQRPVISVETGDGTVNLPVASDVRVKVGSGSAALSDLKAGYHVKATLAYGVVTKIEATAGDILDEARGTVVYVDTKNDSFVLDETEPGAGEGFLVVSVEDVVAIVRFDEVGNAIEMIEKGDRVIVVGHREADRFVATCVVIVGSE
ncbi:MAG TPA: S-layer homology domain-containing protein [Clostridia bacterium]|nr:S-layer homology domain-containing protein [Clostridia bacterium]